MSDNTQHNPALGAARERRRKERHRALPLLPEVRYFDPRRIEVRAAEGDGPDARHVQLEGDPMMWGTEYRVIDRWGEFDERCHAGCVTALLDRGVDCRLLLNHDGLPMARTASGTMELWDTPKSLRFKATLDRQQQLANDFFIAVSRRDLNQMSVGMVVGDDVWGEEGGRETRDIYVLADLLDVSGVTYPASPTTSLEVAQRMAMQRPVESRARLRRLIRDIGEGKKVSRDQMAVLRSLVADPGAVAPRSESRPSSSARSRLSSTQLRRLEVRRQVRALDRQIGDDVRDRIKAVIGR
jgi:HK97 family phage prohead protease